jgi:hypothetical protein
LSYFSPGLLFAKAWFCSRSKQARQVAADSAADAERRELEKRT